jgi:hypothetical protein
MFVLFDLFVLGCIINLADFLGERLIFDLKEPVEYRNFFCIEDIFNNSCF